MRLTSWGSDPEFHAIHLESGSVVDFYSSISPYIGVDGNGSTGELRPPPGKTPEEALVRLAGVIGLLGLEPNFRLNASPFILGSQRGSAGGHVHIEYDARGRVPQGWPVAFRSDPVARIKTILAAALPQFIGGSWPASQVALRRTHSRYGDPLDVRDVEWSPAPNHHGIEIRGMPSWLQSPRLAYNSFKFLEDILSSNKLEDDYSSPLSTWGMKLSPEVWKRDMREQWGWISVSPHLPINTLDWEWLGRVFLRQVVENTRRILVLSSEGETRWGKPIDAHQKYHTPWFEGAEVLFLSRGDRTVAKITPLLAEALGVDAPEYPPIGAGNPEPPSEKVEPRDPLEGIVEGGHCYHAGEFTVFNHDAGISRVVEDTCCGVGGYTPREYRHEDSGRRRPMCNVVPRRTTRHDVVICTEGECSPRRFFHVRTAGGTCYFCGRVV
jgi:hypothetical protein